MYSCRPVAMYVPLQIDIIDAALCMYVHMRACTVGCTYFTGVVSVFKGLCAHARARVRARLKIIGNEIIKTVGNSQSCMVSK